MPVGRLFNDLTIFDVLGNFIPGVVVLATLISVLPTDKAATIASASAGTLVVLSFAAFSLGHMVQRYASEAVGKRERLKNTLLLVQSMTFTEPKDPSNYHAGRRVVYYPYHWWTVTVHDRVRGWFGTSIVSRVVLFPVRFYRSCLEAVLLVRIKRDAPLSDRRLASKAWKVCRKRFDLDDQYRNYGDLLHLMSSDLEREGPSRALRFQAIRNFHRGMWIATIFAAAIFGFVALGEYLPGWVVALVSWFGVEPWTPAVQGHWSPIWTLAAASLLASYGFWELKEKFEEEFVEYLFTDYVTCHAEEHL
jgi:hypothetical protein